MPVHPAPPSDVGELTEAYRTTIASFVSLADGLSEQEWALPTDCPGWTAHDVLAHVVHLTDYLSGSDHPVSGWVQEDAEPISVGHPAHVRNKFGVWIEEGVQARRDRDPRALLAELSGLAEIRTAEMYDPDLALDTPVRSARGRQAAFETVARLRIMDIWCHEQDIREAIGRPGSLDSVGASQFVSAVMDGLPRAVLDRVTPEAGTVVILESTGPITGRAGIRVVRGADGELDGHELFTGHIGESDDAEEHVTTISLSTQALTRRAAGRVDTRDTAYHVVGDEDLARRVLDALTITP